MLAPEAARNRSPAFDDYEPEVAARFRAILREGMTFSTIGSPGTPGHQVRIHAGPGFGGQANRDAMPR